MHRQQGPVLSVYVDDITLAEKKKRIDPMWKTMMKHVDLGGAHIVSESRVLEMHSTRMSTKRRCARSTAIKLMDEKYLDT